MTYVTKKMTGIALLAVVMTLTLAACDSASGLSGDAFSGADDEPSLERQVALLAADLGFSSGETQALTAAFSVGGGQAAFDAEGEAGLLWYVAAELQERLTEEQKERLFARLEELGERPQQGMRRRGGPGGVGPGGGGFGPGGAGAPGFGPGGAGGAGALGMRPGHVPGQGDEHSPFAELGLSAEQEEAIKAIREAARPDIEAILEQRETLSREEFREALDALHQQVRTDVEAVLTAEQLAQLEELKAQREAEREARMAEREADMQARREADRAAMIDVLGLSAEQIDALDALQAEREALRETIQEMIDAGAEREEVLELVDAQRDEHQATVEGLMDEVQLEIVKIHRVISARMAARRGGPGGGQGEPSGGQHGPDNGSGGPGGQGGPGGPGGRMG